MKFYIDSDSQRFTSCDHYWNVYSSKGFYNSAGKSSWVDGWWNEKDDNGQFEWLSENHIHVEILWGEIPNWNEDGEPIS